MVSIYETTISCKICGAVKRIQHLKNPLEEKDCEDWMIYKGKNNRERFVCEECVSIIKKVLNESKKEVSSSRKKK